MKELVDEEERLMSYKGKQLPIELLEQAKKDGFSDKYLSQILDIKENEIRKQRLENNIHQAWEPVHVSGTKDNAYYYSTYNAPDNNRINNDKKKVMILGGGPNRIGV